MKFRLKSMPAGKAKLRTPSGEVVFQDGITDVKSKPVQEFLLTLGHVEKVETLKKKKSSKE